MLIAQITDTHIRPPGKLAYRRVDTAAALRDCVAHVRALDPAPDLVVITGDLTDVGAPEEYAQLHALLAPLALPLLVVPGNHDAREAMRASFAPLGLFPAQGFLHFVVDEPYALRIIGLDTLLPGHGGGALCTSRLDWLARTLARAPGRPTLLLMHHPPFSTGIEHMDALGLQHGREAFVRLVAAHPQIVGILCGHLHRHIETQVGGRRALTAPSPSHQVALDLRPQAPSRFRLEPPGYLLHRWDGNALVSHAVIIGDYEGPYPFFDADGRLIE